MNKIKVDKSISRKPYKYGYSESVKICPCCYEEKGKSTFLAWGQEYCHFCGQFLEWE